MAMMGLFETEFDRALDRMLGGETRGSSQGWVPPADIYETDDHVVIELDAPAVDPENLNVELVDGQLVVSGERQPPQAPRFYRQERWGGRFVRTFTLGQGLRGLTEVNAEYHDGVLRLHLAKPEETKPRQIQISTGGREQHQIVDAKSTQK
jgi:HSP20 family protein